jgi:hypothetical protein
MQRPHRAARCDHPWTTVSRLGDLGLSAREPAASVVRSVLVVTYLSRSPLSRFAAPLLLALACPAAGGGPDPCRGRTPPPAPPWERPPGGGDLAQVPEPCASGTHGHGPGRRLVRPMVHAVSGFTSKSLRSLVAGLLGADYTSAQMTYDLRRLRLHGPSPDCQVLTPTSPHSRACVSPPSIPSSATAYWGRCWPPTTRQHPSRSAAPWPLLITPWATTSPTPALALQHELVTTSRPPAPRTTRSA